jgi:hypothetical protein
MGREPQPYWFANITRHLEGAHFPASKEALLVHARDSGAGQDTLEVLEALPRNQDFRSLADVLDACRKIGDAAPQSGIIDRKP